MLRKLILMAVTLVIVLIVVAVVVPYFIPDNTFKGPILRRVQAMTGYVVTTNGRFQFHIFPVAGVTMKDVTLSNMPHNNDMQPVVTAKSVDVEVSLMPLLGGYVEVRRLVLDEPQIHLHVSKDGIKNWQSSRQATQPAVPAAGNAPAQAAKPQPAPTSAVLPRNLLLSDVKLEDGTVTYDDEADNSHWAMKKLNIALTLNGIASPFTVEASSEWNGKNIAVKGKLTTLKTFFNHERTGIDTDIESDLLSLTSHGFIDAMAYSGKVGAKSSSLKALQAWLNPSAKPLETQAKLALDVSSDVSCTAFMCDLTNVSLTVDKIEAKGSIRTTRAQNAAQPPQIDANLTTNVLDFNPFLSEKQANASGVLISDAYAETNGRWSDKPMDFSVLKAVDGTINIVADGIVMNKITLGRTALRAKLRGGQLDADIADAVMYGGKANVVLNINATGAEPMVEKHVTLSGVQVQPLLKAAADLGRLSGTADMDTTVSSHGKSIKQLVESTSGSGKFTLNNGAIEGVDLVNIIANRPGSGAQKTPINSMNGSFTVAGGVVSNRDLTMVLPTLQVSGAGEINFPAYSINYRLTPQMQTADKSGAAKQGVGVPVLIEGSLDQPSIHPDLKAVAQDALKNPQAFKDQLKNTRDSLKDQLKNPNVKNLKNLLQGF